MVVVVVAATGRLGGISKMCRRAPVSNSIHPIQTPRTHTHSGQTGWGPGAATAGASGGGGGGAGMYITRSSSSGGIGASLDWPPEGSTRTGGSSGGGGGGGSFPLGDPGAWPTLGGGSGSNPSTGGAADWPHLGSVPTPSPFTRAVSAPPDHAELSGAAAASSDFLASAAALQDSRCVPSAD